MRIILKDDDDFCAPDWLIRFLDRCSSRGGVGYTIGGVAALVFLGFVLSEIIVRWWFDW